MTTAVPRTRRGPRASLWTLRTLAGLGALGVLVQPVLAGGYLADEFDYLRHHEATAHALTLIVLLQVLAAAVYWLAGRGQVLPLPLSVLQWLLIGF